MKNELILSKIQTPFGNISLGTHDGAVVLLRFIDNKKDESFINSYSEECGLNLRWEKSNLHLIVEKQLNEYFCGKRTAFSFKLKVIGSDLQVSVWEEIYKIGLSESLSLKELANRVGYLNLKAVERACVTNPISLIIPSHRVEGINNFTGAASRKKLLNRFEQFFMEKLEMRKAA